MYTKFGQNCTRNFREDVENVENVKKLAHDGRRQTRCDQNRSLEVQVTFKNILLTSNKELGQCYLAYL